MVKASALYIVIIIALVIGMLCSSLIVAAYFYRINYQKKFRYDLLENNRESAINIILAGSDSSFSNDRKFSLFNNESDSVILRTRNWGIFDVGMVKSFIATDTLFKSFLYANAIDSTKWAALFLANQDRPFSLSGETTIRGDAYIPKAGVQTAYVDNHAYTGDKRLIIGKKKNSTRDLPKLNSDRIAALKDLLNEKSIGYNLFADEDTIKNSFFKPVQRFNFRKQVKTISGRLISGNIIFQSDTTVFIDSAVQLKNVIIFAPVIIVKSGFKGDCQLFATDSISAGNACLFAYPSCLGLIAKDSVKNKFQAKISLGKNSEFSGLIFTQEQINDQLKPIISIGSKTKVTGQIYSQGSVQLNDKSEIDGSLFTEKFLYKNAFTLYENYLINVKIDSKALSAYYLSSDLIPICLKKKRILRWLESN